MKLLITIFLIFYSLIAIGQQPWRGSTFIIDFGPKGKHDLMLETWRVGNVEYSVQIDENSQDSCFDIYAVKGNLYKNGSSRYTECLAYTKLSYSFIKSFLTTPPDINEVIKLLEDKFPEAVNYLKSIYK